MLESSLSTRDAEEFSLPEAELVLGLALSLCLKEPLCLELDFDDFDDPSFCLLAWRLEKFSKVSLASSPLK